MSTCWSKKILLVWYTHSLIIRKFCYWTRRFIKKVEVGHIDFVFGAMDMSVNAILPIDRHAYTIMGLIQRGVNCTGKVNHFLD